MGWGNSEFIKKPTLASVLYCLLLDAQAADDNFFDWCSNFGYDDDSIKAQQAYNACVKSGRKLKKVFTSGQLQQFSTVLENY